MIRSTVYLCFLAALVLSSESGAAPHPALVIDASDGRVLHQVDATHSWYPASLTKMMTLYLTFKALRSGQVALDEPLTVSAHAAAQPATHLGLRADETIALKQAILATATVSANDAAVVLAERIGTSERAFAGMMTQQAASLGMNGTWFSNASGLPNPYQRTNARDMAILGYRLMHDFPEYFAFFSNRSIVYKGRPRSTTNRFVASYAGANGIKTGFTCDAGYNLVASVARDGKRLIAVVLGAANGDDRARRMANLLTIGYKKVKTAVPAPRVTALKIGLDTRPIRVIPEVCKGRRSRTAARAKERIIESEGNLPGWGLLLGVYTDRGTAKAKAKAARAHLKGVVGHTRIALLPRQFEHGRSWKTLLVGLSRDDAGKACKRLWTHELHCATRSPQVLNRRGFSKR